MKMYIETGGVNNHSNIKINEEYSLNTLLDIVDNGKVVRMKQLSFNYDMYRRSVQKILKKNVCP